MGQAPVKLPRALRGREHVVLDTMVFIYLFEDSPVYAGACEALIAAAAGGEFSGAVTPITAAELLVKPLRQGRHDIADRYRTALRSMANITMAGITPETGQLAGALRAKYGLPLPDMLQVASALDAPHPTLVTNDRRLSRVLEVDLFLLEDMV